MPTEVSRNAEAIVFEFDGAHQLGGYTVDVSSTSAVSVRLQKSTDGSQWRDVPSSALTAAGPGSFRKAIGAGATLSRHLPGRNAEGYRYYRLVTAGSAGCADVAGVTFWLQGVSHYPNPDRIVHLYDHLLSGARWARSHAVAPELSAAAAAVDGELVGPLRLHANQAVTLTVSEGSLVDADGVELQTCEPAGEFYVRPGVGARSATVTATVPARADGFGGRVITGVAVDDANSRLTPVALALPAPLVVNFHLEWNARARPRAIAPRLDLVV